ncbi:MAG: phenylalanine--tRNA ligase subunit beta [Acidobacteria bacterium]|jgi:phenylalanyl-tRNA synthetase beta chain|nr:phenylalanine--tRNA ligase subunit beta [Acidobacteriota bacterium]
MKLPVSWLREYVDAPEDPGRIGEDLTMVGFELGGIEGQGDSAVLDLDVTTNRVDAMNVYGLAREVAVVYSRPLRPLEVSFGETGTPASEALHVEIEAADLCPRFSARVLDVRLGPSPAWLRERLEMVGVRPINNIVDLSNYVMLEMGHPSHAFDLARIPEGRLRVRWAQKGETLETLDEVQRTLSARTGVVAGPRAPLALAGIMGGASSEVSDETQTIALEAAYWEPLAIRRAAKSLGMHTEASHRFERGADSNATVVATARIAHLLQKLGAGTTRPGLIDELPAPIESRQVALRSARVNAVLGTEVPVERCRTILTGLGFETTETGPGEWRVGVPTWRGDVSREADLIEEVGRHHGVDKVPSTIPPSMGVGRLGPGQREERVVRDVLIGAGLTETIQNAFVEDREGAGDEPIRLANPLADHHSVLRSSLVQPGLLEALEANVRQGRRDVAFFELGRVFLPGEPLPVEERRVALLIAGAARAANWRSDEPARPADVFDAKGVLELLFERLGAGPLQLDTGPVRPEILHPGQSAAVVLGGRAIGWLGALRPGERQEREPVVVAELALDPILEAAHAVDRFKPLARFPAVERDLSVVADAGFAAAGLVEKVRDAAGRLLRNVEVKDRYVGRPIPAGKVSLMLGLLYQDPERTLTSEEVQASVDAVIRELRTSGLEIRGE